MEDIPDIQTSVNFDLGEEEISVENAVIRVIGVGGGGGNAVGYMLNSNLGGVDFIAANTDYKALNNIKVTNQIKLGKTVTNGLGAGSDPDKGQKAALADKDTIQSQLAGSDMVFITAGMGGGTGTGAAPIIAEVAKDVGALTVAVVTKPFDFEGKRKIKIAERGIEELLQHVDSLIIVPNQKLLQTQKQLTMKEAFAQSNEILLNSVRGISELITKPGLIGTDFADVRAIMTGMGPCIVVCGEAKSSPSAARDACMGAIKNPLLEDANLEGAQGVLVNITGGDSLSTKDIEEVGEIIREFAAEDAQIKIGAAIDENDDDGIKITIVVTGIEYFDSTSGNDSMSKNTELNNDSITSKPEGGVRQPSAWQGRKAVGSGLSHRLNNQQPSEDRTQGSKRGRGAAIDIPAYMRKMQLD